MVGQPSFQPPWWLRNKHLQSLYASVINKKTTIDLNWEELSLPDGDFLDLAWAGPAPRHAPILLLLHGLEGSVHSHYIQKMLELFIHNDWRVVVMHFRSCSGRMNHSPYLYNAEYTGDVKFVIDTLAERYPDNPLFAMGFSLGGSLLMRYLAKNNDAPVNAAIAVSMPFDMGKSTDYLIPFYQKVLLRSLKQKIEQKINMGMDIPVSAKNLRQIQTLRELDSAVTIPLYGYDCINEYYQISSSRYVLHSIEHPALILHAMDDPFVPHDSVPESSELSESLEFDVSQHGGHMGFINGGLPWNPSYWFANRVTSFFEDHMAGQTLSPWSFLDEDDMLGELI